MALCRQILQNLSIVFNNSPSDDAILAILEIVKHDRVILVNDLIPFTLGNLLHIVLQMSTPNAMRMKSISEKIVSRIFEPAIESIGNFTEIYPAKFCSN
jgi:hypothetical protein